MSFNCNAFSFKGESIPKDWIRWSRGSPETNQYPMRWQHLEFGPSDDEPWFLDDIDVLTGNVTTQLKGGYQILEQMEVGFMINISDTFTSTGLNYQILNTNNEDVKCSDTEIGITIRNLWKDKNKEMINGIQFDQ